MKDTSKFCGGAYRNLVYDMRDVIWDSNVVDIIHKG